MNGVESLMWELERDPRLSSAFANITIFDRPPDRQTFRARMEAATTAVPRLRERVVEQRSPLGHPLWVEDPDFDIDHHLRWVSLGGDADERELLDLVATLSRQPFDRERPLWEFVTIEGLEGGRAAMLQRLHHTITDGEGGIRLSVEFLDFERHPRRPYQPRPHDDAAADEALGLADHPTASVDVAGPRTVGGADASPEESSPWWSRVTGDPIGVIGQGAAGVLAGAATLQTRGAALSNATRSTLRQASVGRRRSPLWAERSLGRWIGTSALLLEDVRSAAHVLGGSINDLFVTGAVAAAGRVHELAGHPVDTLRMSMPISTRHGQSMGGNAFSPTQMLVPTGSMRIEDRFTAVSTVLTSMKSEPSVSLMDQAAGAASLLPSAALVSTGRHITSAVDFVCSNVRAAPFDLFIGGAHMESNHPIGPLVGTAFNLTTMSYRGWLFLGLVVDTAAIDDPDGLQAALGDAYEELFAAAGIAPTRWSEEARWSESARRS